MLTSMSLDVMVCCKFLVIRYVGYLELDERDCFVGFSSINCFASWATQNCSRERRTWGSARITRSGRNRPRRTSSSTRIASICSHWKGQTWGSTIFTRSCSNWKGEPEVQPYELWDLSSGILDLQSPPPQGIFYNRMSASSHKRDIVMRQSLQERGYWLEAHGRKSCEWYRCH